MKNAFVLNNSAFVSLGTFTGGIIRLISDIRLKHGSHAVNLSGCGRFMLADDLSDIADIMHIDLRDIDSLEGTCVFLFAVRRLESPLRTFPHPSFAARQRCFREHSSGDIAVVAHCKSLEKFRAQNTGITGENIPAPFFRSPLTMLPRILHR